MVATIQIQQDDAMNKTFVIRSIVVTQLDRLDLSEEQRSSINGKKLQLNRYRTGRGNGQNGDRVWPKRKFLLDRFAEHLLALELQLDRQYHLFFHRIRRMDPKDKRRF